MSPKEETRMFMRKKHIPARILIVVLAIFTGIAFSFALALPQGTAGRESEREAVKRESEREAAGDAHEGKTS